MQTLNNVGPGKCSGWTDTQCDRGADIRGTKSDWKWEEGNVGTAMSPV